MKKLDNFTIRAKQFVLDLLAITPDKIVDFKETWHQYEYRLEENSRLKPWIEIITSTNYVTIHGRIGECDSHIDYTIYKSSFTKDEWRAIKNINTRNGLWILTQAQKSLKKYDQ